MTGSSPLPLPLLVCGLLLLIACHAGEPAAPRVAEGESTAIVIHAGRDPGANGRAHVDERRWREVPAHGELELGEVALGLELDSVVVESDSDPGGVATRSCHVAGAAEGLRDPSWLWGRQVTVTLARGVAIEGEVIDVGDPVAIIEYGDTRAAVALGAVRVDGDSQPAHRGAPQFGDDVFAIDGDGREIFGRYTAVVPERLVVRTASGETRNLAPDAVERLAVAGIPATPTLRCDVESRRPGRHLVRVTYATGGLSWSAAHRIASMPGGGEPGAVDEVGVVTAYTVAAAALAAPRPARLRLVLGLPGEAASPVTVWEGEATIGGGAVQVTGAPVTRRARVDRVYRGGHDQGGDNPRRPEWHESSSSEVWRELVFERLVGDAPGPLRVAVRGEGGPAADGVRWVDGELAPVSGAEDGAGVVRVVLAPEPALVGFRRKLGRDLVGEVLLDEVAWSVANQGDVEVAVVVEEQLRDVVRPTVVFERIGAGDGGEGGELLRDRWRAEVRVPPGGIVQGQVVLRYRFKRY